MDTRTIEERFLIAGKEYGKALEKLGLDPHALLWAYDEEEERFVLILITDFFDFKGPLEISRQLFKAYNASVTPQEIDPFTVRVHSINQPFGDQVRGMATSDGKVTVADRFNRPKPDLKDVRITAWNFNGLILQPDWVISAKSGADKTPRKNIELSRRWDRFTKNLDKLAA